MLLWFSECSLHARHCASKTQPLASSWPFIVEDKQLSRQCSVWSPIMGEIPSVTEVYRKGISSQLERSRRLVTNWVLRKYTSQMPWVESCPPKKHYIGVLTPITSKFELVWQYILYRDNQIKIRSLGRALISCDWYPCQNGKSRHRARLTEREDGIKSHQTNTTWGGESQWCVYSPRNAKDCHQATRS